MDLKKFFLMRLMVYPVISCIAWSYLYSNFSDFILVKMADQVLLNSMPFPISNEIKILLFGYAFGYVYGTISTVIKVRKFKGILFLGLFAFKVIQSMLLAGSIGIYILALEIILLPFIIILMKKHKAKKKEKLEKQKQEEYNAVKEEVIAELKKQMMEEGKIV
jgi:hypothetical protein